MFLKETSAAKARQTMVEEQLMARGIQDARVLKAMGQIPRHKFLPLPRQWQAYQDKALPIGYGQTISQPYIVALMTELLQLPPDKPIRVLEIGTGSGYQAAVLSQLAAHVYTVERIAPLTRRVQPIYQALNLSNITLKVSDGGYGWAEHAPYEAIMTTAAAPEIPPPLLAQLAEGGTLVAPIGPRRKQQLVRVRRNGDAFETEQLLPVAFVPFLGAHGWDG